MKNDYDCRTETCYIQYYFTKQDLSYSLKFLRYII